MTSIALPNSMTAARQRAATGRLGWAPTLGMLISRLALFTLFQALIALLFTLQGDPDPWQASIAWWPITASLGGITCLFLLNGLARREGLGLLDLYRPGPHTFWKELLIATALFLVSGPLAYFPNVFMGQLLFSDPQQISDLMFRPLPPAANLAAILLFPLTVALTELPTYGGYGLPRLAALTGRPWLAVLLAGLALAAQHIALPLVFDARFLLYRLTMFIPFALWIMAVLRWRPRLLPYLMVGHGLMDLQMILMFQK